MAKMSYSTPASIDRTFLDIEIPLLKNSPPIKIFSLLCMAISASLLFLMFKIFPILAYNAMLSMVFIILWVFTTLFLFRTNEHGEVNFNKLKYLKYYLTNVRKVFTRKSSKPYEFAKLVGILDIDKNNNVIHFADGRKGIMYEVVGNASYMLFSNDRDAILDGVDSFFRKFNESIQFHFVHKIEHQDVYTQLGALQAVVDNARDKPWYDKDLERIVALQGQTLQRQIGRNFLIIKQYLIVSANSIDYLQLANNLIVDEVMNSRLVFKQCVLEREGDICQNLKSIING